MRILILVTLFAIVGCDKSIETKLNVLEKFAVTTSDKRTIILPKAQIKAELVFETAPYIQLKLTLKGESFNPKIPVKLPNISTLLGSLEPIRLTPAQLGQPFGMMVMHKIRKGDDRFIMTFHDKNFEKITGQIVFDYEPETALYDVKTKSFLASYQEVKRKQRAAIIKMDANWDGQMNLQDGPFEWVEDTLDHIMNYYGVMAMSPWLYTRYKKVYWLIGNRKEDWVDKWKHSAANYPVLDYASFVHSGHQKIPDFTSAADLGLKKNQLRLVYTGACYSKNGSFWLKEYDAVAAGGHRNTSASPLYQFTIFRKWIYGNNWEDSAVEGFRLGEERIRLMSWGMLAPLWEKQWGFPGHWDSMEDMVHDSEVMISYNKELPARNLEITSSGILSGKTTEDNVVRKSYFQILTEREGKVWDKPLMDDDKDENPWIQDSFEP